MESPNQFNWEFETITKHTLDIIIIIDQDGIVLFVTPSFESILGYNAEAFIGTNVFEPVNPEDREMLIHSHKQVIATQQPATDEYRVFDHKGNIKYFESRVMPVLNHPDKPVVVAIRDITDRKYMEEELANRKNRYEQLQNSLQRLSHDLSSVMKISDMEERLIKELNVIVPGSNPKFLKLTSETNKVIEEHEIELELISSQLVVGRIVEVSDKLVMKIGERNNHSYIIVLDKHPFKETMDVKWLETLIYFTAMVFENLHVIENLTNQLEYALQSKETPQWVLRLLFKFQERQRQNLSSDLHDSVLQEQLDLYRRFEQLMNQYDMDLQLKEQLKSIEQGLLDNIHQIRLTCNELRPPLLIESGLVQALANLFEYTQLSSTFKIIFETENVNDHPLNEELTIAIYRIIQELLNNAAKHAKASKLKFLISKQETLRIKYCDDGVGFDADQLELSFHRMGLSSMKQRVHSLDGQIQFYSQPGQGLKVEIDFPMIEEQK